MTRANPIIRTSSAVRPTPTILGEQVSSSVKHKAARLSQVRLVRVPDLQEGGNRGPKELMGQEKRKQNKTKKPETVWPP